MQIEFSGSVRGLQKGAAVEYRGIRVGRVIDVSAAVDPAIGDFRTKTTISLSPSLLGLDRTDREGLLIFLSGAVEKGLRAKLAMGNLLTGSLYVNLEDDPGADAATFDASAEVPELPSIVSDIDELTGSVEGILQRVDALPIEALLGNAVVLLENLNRIAADENTRQIPEKALAALAAAEALIARPELAQAAVDAQALVASLRGIVEDPALAAAPGKLDAVLASLGAITAELERQNTAANLAATIAAIRALAETPEFKALPAQAGKALIAAEALVARPELGQAAVDAGALIASLRAVAEDPALKAAPGQLSQALASFTAITGELQRQNTAADLAATVAALRAVAEAPEMKLLPAQATQALAAMTALLEQPALAAVPEQITLTLADVRKTLDLPGLEKIPADLRQTLATVRARLDDPSLAQALTELGPLLAETRAAVKGVSTRSDEVLASLSAILDDPGMRATPKEVAATLQAARTLLEDEGLKDAVGQASATLVALRRILDDPKTRAAPEELTATLASARALLQSLEEAKAAQNLAASLAAAQRLLDDPALAGLERTGAYAGIPARRAGNRRGQGFAPSVGRGLELCNRADRSVPEPERGGLCRGRAGRRKGCQCGCREVAGPGADPDRAAEPGQHPRRQAAGIDQRRVRDELRGRDRDPRDPRRRARGDRSGRPDPAPAELDHSWEMNMVLARPCFLVLLTMCAAGRLRRHARAEVLPAGPLRRRDARGDGGRKRPGHRAARACVAALAAARTDRIGRI